ncbi:polycystin-1 isoform X6 [Pan troglodytes]|uniref:polycystin-1 isoform X6 n=1 Tax=Pan troglodytes TaxID=9598 RepID=UPI00301333BE
MFPVSRHHSGAQQGARMPLVPEADAAQAGGHDAHPAGRDHRGHRDAHRHRRQHPQHHSNYTVSTKVASMAFQTRAGAQIPIERLASERAITMKVPNNSDWAARGHRSSANSVVVQPQASVGAVVTLDSSNSAAVLHLQLNYTLLDGRYLSEESEPYLAVYLHSEPRPNGHNCSASRRIRPESLQGADHRPYTFFISPGSRDPVGSYHLNLSSHFRWSALEVSVGLYASLCQYFSEEDMVWRTEGLLPLEETSPRQAVCLTRHLTAFGASLFVPPSHVRFVFPEPTADVNYIVMLTCAVCLVTYMVMAAILHKLDQLDASRGRAIPFCRQRGRFKYHGPRGHHAVWGGQPEQPLAPGRRQSLPPQQPGHLPDRHPHSLGSVWKIQVWHDNKGLSPAWFLQHIIVRDLQTAHSTFFLVNDWLSVETEANGGLVEKEMLAASDAALLRFRRLLVAELQRGFFDKHIWLSIWDRLPRSCFTRIQRATCCVLLICLFLGANAVWYGAVGDSAYSTGRVSRLSPLSVDTVAVGLVSSVVVYPVYLAILFLFWMSRSKVINTLADLRHRGTDFGGSLWLLIITVFLRSYKFAISLRTSYLSVINTLADLRHRGTDFGGSLWLLIITVFLRSYKFAISLRTSYLSVINTLADLRHRGTDFGGSLWLLIITVFLRSYKFAISLRTSYLSVINTLADLRHRGTDFGGSLWLLIITVFLRSYKFAISLRTSYLSVINTLADLRHRGTDFGGSLWLLIITVFLRSYKFAISLRTSYLSVINTLADLRHRGTDFGGSLWLLIITVFLRSYKFAISLRTSYLSVSFLKTILPSQNGHDGSTDVQQRARRSNHRRQEGIKIVLEAIFTLWRQVKTKVQAKIHKTKVTTKVNRHDKINGKRKTAKEQSPLLQESLFATGSEWRQRSIVILQDCPTGPTSQLKL